MSYETETTDARPSVPARPHRTAGDRLYERFIRDLFGRIVPGLLVLLSLAVSVTSFEEVSIALERANAWMWLLAFGAGWLVTFGLLAIARRLNLFLLTPDAVTDEQYWATEERFRASASRRQHAEYERLITVRDAAAAASMALFLALALLAVDFMVDVNVHESPWSEIRNAATAITMLVGLGIALQMVHREYVRRAWRYLGYGRGTERQGRGPSAPLS